MSLKVPAALLDDAKAGPVSDAEFIECVRSSLPYAWRVVSGVADRLHNGDAEYVVDSTPPPGETEQGELLRMLASSSMRAALERHLGVKLEFQNCCNVAAFRLAAVGNAAHTEFVSARAQLLNQKPELLNC